MMESIKAGNKAHCNQVAGLLGMCVEWIWESFGEDGGCHFRLLLHHEGAAVAAVEDEHLTSHRAEDTKFCLLDNIRRNM